MLQPLSLKAKHTNPTRLSELTAEERREGRFPQLIDRGRRMERPLSFDDPADARDWLARIYRRDRTEDQAVSLDIDRDFVERTGCFDEVVRVALTADQVETYDLPPMVGKATDSRALR